MGLLGARSREPPRWLMWPREELKGPGPVPELRPKLPPLEESERLGSGSGPPSSRLRACSNCARAWLARGPGLRGGWQASVCRLPLLRHSFWPLWAARLCIDRKPFPETPAGLKTDGRMRHCQEQRTDVRLRAGHCLPCQCSCSPGGSSEDAGQGSQVACLVLTPSQHGHLQGDPGITHHIRGMCRAIPCQTDPAQAVRSC